MLGDDSLACFLPRLSLETRKSSLKPEVVRPHPLGSHAPRGLPGTSWEVAALAWLLGKEREGWVTWWKIPAGGNEGVLQRSPPPMLPRVLKGRNSDPFSLGGSRGELRFSFEGLRMPGVAWSSLGSYETKLVGI